ncbi:MAG: hypothetical protein ACD_24C00436G0004 [uncultured bacterium]|nr:MAG: hypothetical protein ACD_24C00436G0004 [uncultured bacterium]
MFVKATKLIDEFLNGITMYRLMLYFLIFLWGEVFILSIFNIFPFSFLQLTFSTIAILLSCYITNKLFSYIFKIPANLESVYISALILVFLVLPANTIPELAFIIVAGSLAMASKYILAINKKHIFNPAAIAVFITSLFSLGYASWWIGNQWTLPVILIGGLLIAKKIKRLSMVLGFLIIFSFATLAFSIINQSDLPKTIYRILVDSPILFFSFVMLLEPLTSPTVKKMQIIYAVLVGVLAGSQFNIGPIYSTYETALILGNIFAYFVSFRKRLVLEFKEKIQMSPNIYEFIFSAPKSLAFLPGQYFEWTVGHRRPDSRGVRRYFTIASAPTENNVRLGVRIDSEKGSSFKKALLNLNVGQKVYAGQLAGDFVLPKNKSQKLVFIAGGIGITPFRSIGKYITDKEEKRDIILFYSNSEPESFVYKDIFEKAKEYGFKTIYVLTKNYENIKWDGHKGRLTAEVIKKEVPDFASRTFYLSGPSKMVESYKKLLKELGIRNHRIVTDYFPGF